MNLIDPFIFFALCDFNCESTKRFVLTNQLFTILFLDNSIPPPPLLTMKCHPF